MYQPDSSGMAFSSVKVTGWLETSGYLTSSGLSDLSQVILAGGGQWERLQSRDTESPGTAEMFGLNWSPWQGLWQETVSRREERERRSWVRLMIL